MFKNKSVWVIILLVFIHLGLAGVSCLFILRLYQQPPHSKHHLNHVKHLSVHTAVFITRETNPVPGPVLILVQIQLRS